MELLEDIIYNAPLVLLTLEGEEMIDLANNYIPYSVGFEIECEYGDCYDVNNFKNIPDIINVNNGNGEQRYRIPRGIKGILCLYNISLQLKINSRLNLGSGTHYHVDMTDIKGIIPESTFINENKEWILNELDTWGYKGKYNRRDVIQHKGGWLGFRGNTAEFRCGEMTFEYKELLKNIISATSIIKRVKTLLGFQYQGTPREELDTSAILSYAEKGINKVYYDVKHLQEQLKEAMKEEIIEQNPNKMEEMRRIVANRKAKNI